MKYNTKGIKPYKQKKSMSLAETREIIRFFWDIMGKYPNIPFDEAQDLLVESGGPRQ